MLKSLLVITTCLLLHFAEVSCLKVGFLSDIHLHARYDPLVGVEGLCIKDSNDTTKVSAPMGRYGCDSPTELIETMFKRFNEKFGK